jgi:membrane-bound metal-dependent hydrolase YbcI (DUF457 family)
MSWAAHELESYVIRRHLHVPLAFSAVLLGSLAPDLLTKLPVYGVRIGSRTYLKADDPALWHRAWPGAGFTTSLFFGLVLFVVALAITRHRAWALGLLVGQWAHVLTDSFDSVGTMLFFPFSTDRYAVGLWSYSAQAGRYGDAAAYYSSLGGLWDMAWLAAGLASFEVLRHGWFTREIEPTDPLWAWLRRRWHLRRSTLLALYRAWFVYAACRIVGWTLWARFVNPDRGTMTFDPTWGGPAWVARAPGPEATTWWSFVADSVAGAAGLAVTAWIGWRLVGRRLWRRAGEPPGPATPSSGAAPPASRTSPGCGRGPGAGSRTPTAAPCTDPALPASGSRSPSPA